jgi:hypothetical protein
MNQVTRKTLALIGAGVLLGCELSTDDGGTGGGPNDTTVNLSSAAALDGFAGGNGSFGTSGGGIALTGDVSGVAGSGFRQFFSFDISQIPAGSTIVQATLRLYQVNVTGTPYTELGNVVIDHLDYGASLDGTDYAAPALTSNAGTLSNNATLEYKQVGVAAAVQADLAAARTRSQFRTRFSTADFSNDGTSDYVQFADEDSPTNRPVLVVVYH